MEFSDINEAWQSPLSTQLYEMEQNSNFGFDPHMTEQARVPDPRKFDPPCFQESVSRYDVPKKKIKQKRQNNDNQNNNNHYTTDVQSNESDSRAHLGTVLKEVKEIIKNNNTQKGITCNNIYEHLSECKKCKDLIKTSDDKKYLDSEKRQLLMIVLGGIGIILLLDYLTYKKS